jgi:hypothetical protein
MMHLRRLKDARKVGFSARVSALALKVCPGSLAASFHQEGTNPHRVMLASHSPRPEHDDACRGGNVEARLEGGRYDDLSVLGPGFLEDPRHHPTAHAAHPLLSSIAPWGAETPVSVCSTSTPDSVKSR